MNTYVGLWRLLDQRQRRWLIALQLLSLLMAVSTVSGIAAVLPFFTVLTGPGSIDQHASLQYLFLHLGFHSERDFVIALGVAFCVVVVLANAINFFGSMAMYRFSYQVGDAFQGALFHEYLRRNYDFHSTVGSAVLASNVLYETARISGGILQNGLILVTNGVTIAFIVASILVVNPRVAIVAAVALGASYTAIYVLSRARLLLNGELESRFFAQRCKIVTEGLGAIKEVILWQADGFFARRFAACCKPYSTSMLSTIGISQRPRHILEVATVCGLVCGALYLSGRRDGTGGWIAQLSFIGLAAYRLLPALQQAFTAVVRIRADSPAFVSVGADLAIARGRALRGSSVLLDAAWRGRPRREMRLEAVSMRHAADRPCALSAITLRIPAGAILGVVGVNGSGKSTLVDVLAGLLVPQSGRVEIDGILLDAANRGAWRAAVAYVPQQTVLLDATFAENIAFGIPAPQIDQNRLRAAIRLAQLDDCLAGLPHGPEEMLGERGCRLSGGQRQRLGIARALYRGASVLIMDEATSSLDGDAEEEIIDMLLTLGRERTIILVAHRLRSLRHCDLIVEMQTGRIVRSGSYDQLAGLSGARAGHAGQDRHTAR